jgi:hypothetical protein
VGSKRKKISLYPPDIHKVNMDARPARFSWNEMTSSTVLAVVTNLELAGRGEQVN